MIHNRVAVCVAIKFLKQLEEKNADLYIGVCYVKRLHTLRTNPYNLSLF